MKYQPRYVAYLALIGGEEFASNLDFISFIGIMTNQYESFRGVPEGTPISDHKEFTAFIQRWVHHSGAVAPKMVMGVDLASGQDKTVMVEAKRDNDGVLILGNNMIEIPLNSEVCVNCGNPLPPDAPDVICCEENDY